jgi:serine protease
MLTRIFLGSLCAALAGLASAAEYSPARLAAAPDAPVHRVIVQWKDDGRVQALSAAAPNAPAQRVRQLAASSGVAVTAVRDLAPRMQLLRLPQALRGAELNQAIASLQADARVQSVQPDLRKFALAVPNDPLFAGQWYLQAAEPAGINAVGAWDLSASSLGTVVAVLDTGVRFDHPDLKRASEAGKLLPGYDMIDADAAGLYATANDGNGRDADPSDPGDWVSAQDRSRPEYSACSETESSWHGTRVAGVIGALTNNSVGIAGVGWNAWILPVRVLGKCGGYDSDVIDGIRWAAGLPVAGVPDNPHPAKIINLSLGSATACTAAYQNVVDEVAARGVLLVSSAGNETGPVNEPANCTGVLGVGGLRHVGTKVGYSSLGEQVGISAPAGNCVNLTGACLFPISSTSNNGTTIPGSSIYTDQVTQVTVGTSFSAPLAAGVAALMHGVNGRLSAAALKARMQAGARPFPAADPSLPQCAPGLDPNGASGGQCNCTTATCGAGMLDALGAVNQALRPIADLTLPASYSPGQTLTLVGGASSASCNRTIASYKWEIVSGSGGFNGSTDTANAVVTAPASGSFTVRLTVTDDLGRLDTDTVVIGANAPTFPEASEASAGQACPTPITVAQDPGNGGGNGGGGGGGAAPGGGGGGGGAVGWELLALLAVAGGLMRRRQTAAR